MVRAYILAALATLLPLNALAASTRYDCTFQTGTKRDGNWVPTVLVLQHDDKTGEIVVFDPIIKHFIGKPITAILAEQTRVRTVFAWDVEAKKAGMRERQQARMSYRFSYFSNGQPARVRVTPLGYDNQWEGEGTCTVKKG